MGEGGEAPDLGGRGGGGRERSEGESEESGAAPHLFSSPPGGRGTAARQRIAFRVAASGHAHTTKGPACADLVPCRCEDVDEPPECAQHDELHAARVRESQTERG